MKDIKYEVLQLPCESIGMSVRIMKMENKEDIESELAMFLQEKGIISKTRYEDYILSVYIINIGQLLYFINLNKDLVSNFDNFRIELLDMLYTVNPMLNPIGLIINPFGIIKVDDGISIIDGYPLVDNKSWESNTQGSEDFVFDNKNVNDIVSKPENEDDQAEKQMLDAHILKTIDTVSKVKHTYKKKWWDRLTMYIVIRQFAEKDLKKIILLGSYEDLPSYQSFIVTSFIKDVESVFALIDSFGLLMKFTPQQMVDELYNLCVKVNPDIKYENLNKKKNTATTCKKKASQKTEYKALNDISSEQMADLDKYVSSHVIGQEKAIDLITKAIRRAKIGIKEPSIPIGSFLLAGRTGVGKTLLAKTISDKLFKEYADGGFIRIDCSEYSSDHEYSKLIGSPAGYVRSDEGGILTNAVMENPFSVVLFDEVEKASPKVHQLMLQIMDEGRLTDNQGETVSFKDTLVLMTSNIGAENVQNINKTIGFGDVAHVTDEKKNTAISKAITDTFKPEFLNRLSSVVYFNDIDKKTCTKIAELELEKINGYLKSKNITINFSRSVRNLILKEGYSQTYGAREIKRTVERFVSDSFADHLIDNCICGNAIFDTKVKNKKVKYIKTKTITDFVSNVPQSAKCANCK